ncbi:MAG: hypothetical protein AB7N80_01825 [Bdellovibrionales bacterium]
MKKTTCLLSFLTAVLMVPAFAQHSDRAKEQAWRNQIGQQMARVIKSGVGATYAIDLDLDGKVDIRVGFVRVAQKQTPYYRVVRLEFGHQDLYPTVCLSERQKCPGWLDSYAYYDVCNLRGGRGPACPHSSQSEAVYPFGDLLDIYTKQTFNHALPDAEQMNNLPALLKYLSAQPK